MTTAAGYELEIVEGKGRGRRVPLPPAGRLVLGRDRSCDVVLEDPSVSKVHARLESSAAGIRVVDLGSHNGILAGGERVRELVLAPGAKFQLGEHVLCLRPSRAAPAAAADPTAIDHGTVRFAQEAPRGEALPATIGPYRILDRVAEGGMGTVYVGEAPAGAARVAVKVLRKDFHGSAEMRERFEQEIRLSRLLDHPTIVRYVDAGLDGKRQYLVSEYVDGVSARDIVAQGPIALDRALAWARQIAGALVHAHARRVLHRDLKPANLLVEHDSDRIRIIDFGLGRALDEDNARLTFTGQSMGTAQYASPEQLFDAKSVDARTDVYGLGACLYTFLTGLPPVRSKNTVRIMQEMKEGALYPLQNLRPDVPANVADVVQRCLCRDAAGRYQSAAELEAALG